MDRRERFRKAKSFAIYYGYGKEDKLGKYDVVIIESRGQTLESMKIIKASKTLSLGYLSVIEINPTDNRFRYLKEEDLIKCNGKIELNSIYGNYLVDIRSKRWQDILLHECGRMIEGMGCDGIFLDTIGNVESPNIIKEYGNSLINETIIFLNKLRSRYPQHIIVQNNAIEKLIHYSSGIIDGICWENPPVGVKNSRLWMEEIVSRLNIMKESDQLKLLVVIESDNMDDSRKLQMFDEMGYVTYLSPRNYLDIV